MARYKEWVHQEVMRLGDPITVKIMWVKHELLVIVYESQTIVYDRIHSEHLQRMAFLSMISKRTWILECCHQQSFQVRVLKWDLKWPQNIIFLYMVQSTHFRSKRGHWLTSNLIPKKDKIFGIFWPKNTKNDYETHKKYWNHFLYLFIRYRQKLFFEILSFRNFVFFEN